MPMYDLIEYSSNYSKTAGSLWFHSKNEATGFNNNTANTDDFKSLRYRTKLLGKIKAQLNPNNANGILKNAAVAISNYWRSLEIPLINCKEEWKLKWTKYCVLSEAENDNANDNDSANNITFTIKDTKLHVPVVTFSARENQKIIKTF